MGTELEENFRKLEIQTERLVFNITGFNNAMEGNTDIDDRSHLEFFEGLALRIQVGLDDMEQFFMGDLYDTNGGIVPTGKQLDLSSKFWEVKQRIESLVETGRKCLSSRSEDGSDGNKQGGK